MHYLWIGGSCFSVTQRKIGVGEADRSSVELLIYVVQKPWEPKRTRDSSDALEGSGEGVDVRRAGLRAGLRQGVVGLVAACDLLRHASPEAE